MVGRCPHVDSGHSMLWVVGAHGAGCVSGRRQGRGSPCRRLTKGQVGEAPPGRGPTLLGCPRGHRALLAHLPLKAGHGFRALKVLVVQLCPTLCNPMDCNLPGSSVCGTF